MGGQQLDGAVGQGAHLHARTLQRLSGDPLLHDAAVAFEGAQIGFDGKGFGLRPRLTALRRTIETDDLTIMKLSEDAF